MANQGGSRRGPRVLFLILLIGVGLVPVVNWWRSRQLNSLATRCRDAVRSENWDVAQPLAEQWARKAPGDAEAWINLADVAKARGDLQATADCLGRIPTTDSRYLNTQMLRGDLLLDGLKRPDLAVEVWKAMLAVSPQADVAHQRLLFVDSMTLQRETMVRQIRDAIRHHAEPPEAYGYILSAPNLLFTNGYVKVSEWLQANPQNETLRVAQAIFAARTTPSGGMKMFGSKAVQAGDATGVAICLKDYPENLELRAFLIEKAIADADMSALGKLLQKLPETADRDSRFWRYIGTFRDSQRRPDEAAEAYRQSIQLHPLDWKSHYDLGTVERVLGHVDLAARHSELGSRGKQLEREIMELPNAAQVDEPLLQRLLIYARDCGDQDVVDGLSYRLGGAIPAR